MIQIKVALAAIHNIRGLHSAQDVQKHGGVRDLFDFLQYWFGFQVIYSRFLALLPFLFFCTVSRGIISHIKLANWKFMT